MTYRFYIHHTRLLIPSAWVRWQMVFPSRRPTQPRRRRQPPTSRRCAGTWSCRCRTRYRCAWASSCPSCPRSRACRRSPRRCPTLSRQRSWWSRGRGSMPPCSCRLGERDSSARRPCRCRSSRCRPWAARKWMLWVAWARRGRFPCRQWWAWRSWCRWWASGSRPRSSRFQVPRPSRCGCLCHHDSILDGQHLIP